MAENLFVDVEKVLAAADIPPLPSSDIVGTITNDDAPPGDIGEFASSAVTVFASAPASTAWGDMIRMTLTPGDWDLTLNTQLALGATSSGVGTGFAIAISGTSGASSASLGTLRVS